MKNSMHKLRSLSIAFDLVSFLLSFGLSYSISDYSQKPKRKGKNKKQQTRMVSFVCIPKQQIDQPKIKRNGLKGFAQLSKCVSDLSHHALVPSPDEVPPLGFLISPYEKLLFFTICKTKKPRYCDHFFFSILLEKNNIKTL